MAWSPPRAWNPGETVTAALMNAHVRDNLNVLKTKIDDDGSLRTLYYGDPTWKQNSDAGEDDLNSFTIAANDLNGAGQGFRVVTLGALANNANAKTIRFRVAGVLVIPNLVTTSLAVAGNIFTIEVEFWYVNATNIRCWAKSTCNAASGGAPPAIRHFNTTVAGLDWTINQEVKFTGEAVTTGDIVMHGLSVNAIR